MKEIPLSNGLVALVDDEDYPLLSPLTWSWVNSHAPGYAQAQVPWLGRQMLMHRLILGVSPLEVVDHLNGNGLDNRRSNLRRATLSQNSQNRRKRAGLSSTYKGVSFYRRTGKWRATIKLYGRDRHIGYFPSADEAARAYDAQALALFGAFARLNFPAESSADASPACTPAASSLDTSP